MKITVNRQKWMRGLGIGRLFDSTSGKMCCLGFAALQNGGTSERIKDRCCPSDVPDLLPMLVKNHECKYNVCESHELDDSALANKLMSTNDDVNISDLVREEIIVSLGKEAGLEFEFIN